jgi:hypothetical protein
MTSTHWHRRLRRAGCAAAVFVLAGCSGPEPLPGPQPHPVHGKVVYRGQPAQGFRVAFYPLGQQDGPTFAPSAMTDQKGHFRLRSYQPDDGAPAGEYAVTFQWPQQVNTGDPDDAQPEIDRLRGRLSNPRTSRFHVTVHEGENELEPFVLP